MSTHVQLPPLPEIKAGDTVRVVRRRTTQTIPINQPARHGGQMTHNADLTYINPEQAAKILCVKPDTIRNRIKAGLIPAYRTGRRLLIKRSDLVSYAEGTPLS